MKNNFSNKNDENRFKYVKLLNNVVNDIQLSRKIEKSI